MEAEYCKKQWIIDGFRYYLERKGNLIYLLAVENTSKEAWEVEIAENSATKLLFHLFQDPVLKLVKLIFQKFEKKEFQRRFQVIWFFLHSTW